MTTNQNGATAERPLPLLTKENVGSCYYIGIHADKETAEQVLASAYNHEATNLEELHEIFPGFYIFTTSEKKALAWFGAVEQLKFDVDRIETPRFRVLIEQRAQKRWDGIPTEPISKAMRKSHTPIQLPAPLPENIIRELEFA